MKHINKTFLSLTFLLLSTLVLQAQMTLNEKIKLGPNDEARSVEATSDGGYALTGVHTNSATGNQHVYLFKSDDMGQEEFTTVFGIGSSAAGNRVEQTADGGYIIAGRTNGGALSTGPSASLIKASSTGVQQWIQHYGNIGPEEFYAVQEVSLSPVFDPYRYFACGVAFTGDNRDVYVAKVDANGALLDSEIFNFGGGEVGYTMMATPGGFLIAGSKTSPGTDNVDVLLMKIDFNLNLLWARTYGGAGKEEGLAMSRTADGHVAISGISNSFSNGREDIYLLKVDPGNGALIWSRIYGRRGNEFSSGVVSTADGGLVLTGGHIRNNTTTSEGYLLKVDDDDGSIKWDYKFGETNAQENFYALDITTDGGFVMAGQIDPLSVSTVINKNVWLVKTMDDGTGACQTGLNFLTLVPPTAVAVELGIQADYGGPMLSLQYPVAAAPEIRRLCCACDDINVSFTGLFATSCFQPTPGIAVGSVVQLINTSDCATRFKWFVNGVEVSTDENYTWIPSRPGVFEITLKGKVAGCSFVSFTKEFIVYPGCYCPSAGVNSTFAHIDEFCMNGDCNFSDDNGGYEYFPKVYTAVRGVASPVTILPDVSSLPANVYARIWIDYNQDESFDPVSEIAFDVFGTGPFGGFITPPLSAMDGPTLMRVQIKTPPSLGTGPPDACETFASGEVEDYIINILPPRMAADASTPEMVTAWPNPATDLVTVSLDLPQAESVATIQLVDMAGRIVMSEVMSDLPAGTTQHQIDVSGLAAGVYQLNLAGEATQEGTRIVVTK